MPIRADDRAAMSTVGILGGGQLTRMLALAAAPLGVRTLALEPSAAPCAGEVTTVLQAQYDDPQALAGFAGRIDVATFDFENVPASAARHLAGQVPVFPGPDALAITQDRLNEKTLFTELGLATPAFAAIDSLDALHRALDDIGLPAVLKTRRLGYDGKGQARLHRRQDADAAWQALGDGQVPLILEAFVPFQRELSVLAVRGRDGDFRTWPLTRNWHDHGILSLSVPVADIDPALADQAFGHARAIAGKLGYVGVFALELFEHEGRLLGNEMAPRVHNSGHWTIEGAATSQFENHLRAVLGLPLGETRLIEPCAMLNLIGHLPDRSGALAVPGLHWHDYGKRARPGRKVGHATIRAPDPDTLQERLARAAQAIDHPALEIVTTLSRN